MASAALDALDARERGYVRTALPLSQLELLSDAPGSTTPERAAALRALLAAPAARAWLYVPTPAASAPPSEDFPICQTYVDVCVAGCLAWGGDAFASAFLTTTHGWCARAAARVLTGQSARADVARAGRASG